MKKIFSVLFVIAIMLAAGCVSPDPEPDDVLEDGILEASYYTDLYNFNQTDNLGRGINMGNFLESPRVTGGEGSIINEADPVLVKKEYFTLIKEAGFKTIRLPVRWSDYSAMTDPYTIEAPFLARVKEVVDMALAENLIVVLDFHSYFDMTSFDGSNTIEFHRERLVKVWDQICDAFTVADYPVDTLYFELLNEPFDRITMPIWNEIVADLTTLIWTTKGQATRKLVITHAGWGGTESFQNLVLPEACNNTNTVITFHYYEPFHFTHQKVDWVEGSFDWADTDWTAKYYQKRIIESDMDEVVTWNKANGNFELWLGEFGGINDTTDNDQQRAWTAFVAREAEKRGISWAYWEFCDGFGAYDWRTDQWREYLLTALIPE